MYFLFSVVSSCKKSMPTSQYVRHALHCDSGSTSTISHSSVFPAAVIASCDSLLKGLNARCCWRSLWSAFRWGWFSICWIKLWTLMPCDRFTISFGTPEMLKSMFSSSIARLNLFAFDDAVSRCSGEPNSCTACVLDSTSFPVCRELAWRDCLHTSQVSPFYQKNQVLLANTYQQSLVNKTCFLSPRVSPFDHRLYWVWIGLVWKIQHEVLLQKTVERSFQLAVVQL